MNLMLSFTFSSRNKQSLSSSGMALNLPVSKAYGNVPECETVHKDLCLFFFFFFFFFAVLQYNRNLKTDWIDLWWTLLKLQGSQEHQTPEA